MQEQDNISKFYEDCQGEADILKVEHGSTYSSPPASAISYASTNATLSPDMFDSLADQIVNRVKKELNISSPNRRMASEKNHKKPYSPGMYSGRTQRSAQGSPVVNLDSHHCPSCKVKMVSSSIFSCYILRLSLYQYGMDILAIQFNSIQYFLASFICNFTCGTDLIICYNFMT